MTRTLEALNRKVTRCRRCPRLVEHREAIAATKTRRFKDQSYWGKAVPAFGDPQARLLIIGLAPAAHGANRTGRMFTGDRSGDWLYGALHRFGFASQADSVDRGDGLKLDDCYITAAARCAPPGNKPTAGEFANCRPYLLDELRLLDQVRVVVALGKLAFDHYLSACRELGLDIPKPKPKFGHGIHTTLSWTSLIASYHPSQQNTFTGKLTAPMFDSVFEQVRTILD